MTEPVLVLTPSELLMLRGMVDEVDATGGWTDERLSDMADANRAPDGSLALRSAASAVWEIKAASYVDAVNISESGSSRSEAAKFDHAMAMVKRYGGADETGGVTPVASPQSTKMVRATRGG